MKDQVMSPETPVKRKEMSSQTSYQKSCEQLASGFWSRVSLMCNCHTILGNTKLEMFEY